MMLDEFFDYKNELMKTLCSNERIVEIVSASKSAEVPNYSLAYSQIYPYEYVPDTVDDAKTFICFDVDIPRVIDKTYYSPVLYVWIFTHKSNLRLREGGLLLDELAVAINKELNGSRYFGLGEMDLSSVVRFSPIDDYLGRVLTYKTVDFNRVGYKQRPPVNRKQHE